MGELYRQKFGKHHKDGKVYLPGELVELTPQEALAFADKFEKVEAPATSEPPLDNGKKGK